MFECEETLFQGTTFTTAQVPTLMAWLPAASQKIAGWQGRWWILIYFSSSLKIPGGRESASLVRYEILFWSLTNLGHFRVCMRSRCRAGSPRPSRESWGTLGLSTGAETQARCELWGQFLPVCNCFSNVSGQEAGLLSVWKEAEIVQTVDGTFVLFSMDWTVSCEPLSVTFYQLSSVQSEMDIFMGIFYVEKAWQSVMFHVNLCQTAYSTERL